MQSLKKASITNEQPAFIMAYVLPSMLGSIRAQYMKVLQHTYLRTRICSDVGPTTIKCTYFIYWKIIKIK